MWLSVVQAPAPRAELLSLPERDLLARAGWRGPRRDEWIAGRLAARRLLEQRLGLEARDVSVLAEPSGAPRVTGSTVPLSVSLSHDAGRIAVALAPGCGLVAIDVCDRTHARRLPAILRRLRVASDRLDACATWAALECALKLRGLGVVALLCARLAIVRTGADRLRVSGLGADAACRVASRADYALAWAEEAA